MESSHTAQSDAAEKVKSRKQPARRRSVRGCQAQQLRPSQDLIWELIEPDVSRGKVHHGARPKSSGIAPSLELDVP